MLVLLSKSTIFFANCTSSLATTDISMASSPMKKWISGMSYHEVDEMMSRLKVGMHKIKPCTRKMPLNCVAS